MKSNTKRRITIIAVSLFVIVCAGYVFLHYPWVNPKKAYSQEYVVGTGNIQGDVDVEKFNEISNDFAIGANEDGYAVFKHPNRALMRLRKEYKAGIELIKSEYDLIGFNRFNYDEYGTYGCQVTTGTEEEREQAYFVTDFMDIYENSLK